MSRPLAYFEDVRQRAARRWDQLEADPDLAGPWHQLFKQVQSPRHVVSELLQNADDAGATEATVRIEGDVFLFDHDGEDFTEEHFESLCRFGYSNKRTLHTIGFRGIGFKSTFSLGDRVELFSPTLSVCFRQSRFTQPHWIPERPDIGSRTRIRVRIHQKRRRGEVEKNLKEWIESPVSLLFFRHIRSVTIGDRELHWKALGPGPVSKSEWMAMREDTERRYLLIRSEEEPFPVEAMEEIRDERMAGGGEGIDLPPCAVELVLGASGRLYVVLPTGIETKLPFACNAPFIQDPARLKIKDPETSPTNQWLLERTGNLAGTAMLRWLGQDERPPADRAPAYGLLPDVDREDASIEGVSSTAVEEAFEQEIEGHPFLLTEQGKLVGKKESVIIPEPILDVWGDDRCGKLLDSRHRPALCRTVTADDRSKLKRWGLVEELSMKDLLEVLRQRHLPKPKRWDQLLDLWAFIAPQITSYFFSDIGELHIMPVHAKKVLYAANEVVRLGERRLLQSEDDWQFLARYLVVLNQNWLRFLADRRRKASENDDAAMRDAVESAFTVLEKSELAEPSDASSILEQVAAELCSREEIDRQDSVRLAQVAAKMGANVKESFCYVTRDNCVRGVSDTVYFDEAGTLEELLPEDEQSERLLHADYSKSFISCSKQEWVSWAASRRSGLASFVQLKEVNIGIYDRRKARYQANLRGFRGELHCPYVTNGFLLKDWDFDEAYWRHWKKLAADDALVWYKVVERIIERWDAYRNRAVGARILQRATTGRLRSTTSEPLVSRWILRLREMPCLPDTRGIPRKPEDLLRRTPITEALLDVEPFVDGLLDRENAREFLDLLGVRSTPTGPDRILERLRALSNAERPPINEVEKWYRRLDQIIDSCSTSDFEDLSNVFRGEKLILTQDGTWVTSGFIFLATDEQDVPGAPVVRDSVKDLSLWRKLGVAERPSAELAMEWLRGLPADRPLSMEEARRVRALLMRYPVRIWEECGYWLNLAGEWVPVDRLSYALTLQSLIPWSHFHPWVKQQTADFQRLPAEISGNPPFSKLPALAGHVEERFHTDPMFSGQPEAKPWLETLGGELCRVELDSEEETETIRALAMRLARTNWQQTAGFEIIPYIGGTPAGTPRRTDVVWLGQTLHVDRLSSAKLARRVPEEIGRAFNRTEIKAALDYGFERDPQDVREYVAANFKLAPPEHVQEDQSDGTASEKPENPDEFHAGGDTESEEESFLEGEEEEEVHTGENTESITEEPTEQAGDDSPGNDPRPRRRQTPPKPNIMERFAKVNGFRMDGDQRFIHPDDGDWIDRCGGPFPWERRSASGDLVRQYLPKDHCLGRAPLEIEADVWGPLDGNPDTYALVLVDLEGKPVEVTGSQLVAMRDEGTITLFPATYRLVHSNDIES